ncbi:MAG: DMT family transporter [Myxococcota bacterium]|nr:DMT family transporter [Myxococcota bacterium]
MQWLSGPAGWCVLSAILFGASTPLCKPLLETMGPFTLGALLYLGAGGVSVFTVFRRAETTPRAGDKWRVMGAVCFGGILGPVLLLIGLRTGDAGSASLLLNLESVATALLGWLFFKEHISGRGWLATGLVFGAGVMLALPVESAQFSAALWIGAACLCWGFDNHLTATIVEFSPAQTTCIKGLGAGLVNGLIAYGIGEPVMHLSAQSAMVALCIGAVCYGGSIILYVASAQQLGATHAQVIFSSAPYWGLLLAWFLLDESLGAAHLGAVVFMVVALWLLRRDQHGHYHVHEAESHSHWHRHDPDHHHHVHRPGMWSVLGWHYHGHDHEAVAHTHEHRSDIHHRHH